jgi:hypothetical protein
MQRRDFLKGAAVSLSGAAFAQAPHAPVSLVLDPHDPLTSSPPVVWAAGDLENALSAHGILIKRLESVAQAPATGLVIVITGHGAPAAPEALSLSESHVGGRTVIEAAGHDARGLMYAVLELADRVRYPADPAAALHIPKPITEEPANKVRAVSRLFTSDVEDKPWFNDRDMWPAYFSMLAAQRINRFQLAFGIGYDFLREVTDAYFLFFYPFVVDVPGYKVRAANLPDEERDRNLEMLRYIVRQAAAHGIDFQLGVWMHGYQWANSPHANYTIEGLTAENHASYCRDALTMVLRACPEITGVTFRIHGESGVPEGSYDFWGTVFDAIRKSGRKLEIDLHPKGVDEKMIETGLATGMPVKVSPKFWAEHMGLPYHQADIRPDEIPKPNHKDQGPMALSSGSRSFTRYGYADLLREDRQYGVYFRIWPGTHRLLLWGDPEANAAYSRAFQFCGCEGIDLMEPLSFMGRRGSGAAGARTGYADSAVKPRWDWEKFVYTYRTWGRLMYNPQCDPDVWRRYLDRTFDAPQAVETEMASASRILPLITTAHCPSAANNNYWPEIYTNQPIVTPTPNGREYSDTPAPKVFGNTSPLDPELFLTVNECAQELLEGKCSGKYSPIEVAQWLEDLGASVLGRVEVLGRGASARRAESDAQIQARLGRFFAAKFRAGVLYGIYERSKDRAALELAIAQYRKARSLWPHRPPEYLTDIAAGELPWLRGNWDDRTGAIDADIADMEKQLASADKAADGAEQVRRAIRGALGKPQRPPWGCCMHQPTKNFEPGKSLYINAEVPAEGPGVESVRLHYRHVNQGERFRTVAMVSGEAVIPAEYTNSPFPLQYYFEWRLSPDSATIYPGFFPPVRPGEPPILTNQPYFVVRRKS